MDKINSLDVQSNSYFEYSFTAGGGAGPVSTNTNRYMDTTENR